MLREALFKSSLSGLEASMSRLGQIEPVIIRPITTQNGKYELVCGARRFQAAKDLGWQEIYARILDLDDKSAANIMLAENLERKDLSDYEIGKFFVNLSREFGMSYSDIAQFSGKSKAYVSQHVSMVSLFGETLLKDPFVQNIMETLSEREARVLLRVDSEKARLSLAKIAIQDHLCVKELEKLVGRSSSGLLTSRESALIRGNGLARPSDKEQIRDVIANLFECVNNKNLQPLIQFRDEEGFTLFDDFPPLSLHRGKAAIDHCFDVIEITRGKLVFRYSNLRIKCFNGFAIATFYLNYESIDIRPKLSHRSRVSVVLAKRKRKWIIVHEHWSPLQKSPLWKVQEEELQLQSKVTLNRQVAQ